MKKVYSKPRPVVFKKITEGEPPKRQLEQTKGEKVKKKTKYETINLSPEQQRVLEAALAGKSLFLTGNAGTGKSVVLKEIVRVLKKKFQNDEFAQVYVTAPTGVAACNVNGCTIHSFSGLGIGEIDKLTAAKSIWKNKPRREKWENTKVLVIDEISMVSAEMFDMLEYIAKHVRKSSQPFGGIQVILCGDFLQLPPIAQKKELHFCFEAETWKEVVKQTFELTTQFRQNNDVKFTQILNEIRIGQVSKESELELKKCIRKVLPTSKIEATKLYPHKETVSSENSTRLNRLDGDSVEFKSHDSGEGSFLESLKKNCSAPERLILKKGAQVILLKNLAVEEGLVNGSRGIVSDFSKDGNPIVQFACHTREMEREEFKLVAGNETKATRRQYPLDLAWAISIHKSQGMTIDLVQTSLNSVFEYGQAYVALSRCRSLEGLTITDDFDVKKFRAHPKVLEFYSSFKNIPNRNVVAPVVKPPTQTILQVAPKPIIPVRKMDPIEIIDLEDDELEEMSLSQIKSVIPMISVPSLDEMESINLKEYILGPSCVNESKHANLAKLLLGRGHLESEEGDARLLIEIPFSEKVCVEGIRLGMRNDDSKPKKISIYVDVNNKNLQTIKSVHPRVTFEYPGNWIPIKIENPKYLIIFVEESQRSGVSSVLTSLEIVGIPRASM